MAEPDKGRMAMRHVVHALKRHTSLYGFIG